MFEDWLRIKVEFLRIQRNFFGVLGILMDLNPSKPTGDIRTFSLFVKS